MVEKLNAQLFRLSSTLLQAQSPENDYRIIQLQKNILHSPEKIREFRAFLRKLKKSSAGEIVWLSHEIPQMDYIEANADSLTEVKVKGKKSAKENPAVGDKQWLPSQGENNKLAWMLKDQKVFLGQSKVIPMLIPMGVTGANNSFTYTDTLNFQKKWQQYIPSVFLPLVDSIQLLNNHSDYRIYPFNERPTEQQTLIWYGPNKNHTLPDLSLALFAQFQKIQKINWSEEGIISLDSQQLKISLSGKIFQYFSQLTGRHTDLNIVSLAQAKKQSNAYYQDKIILMGEHRAQLQKLADTLSSLNAAAIYYTPVFSWWLLPALLLFIGCYLGLILPLLTRPSGLILGALIILGCVFTQHIILMINGAWWPIFNIMLFIIAGHITVYIYLSIQSVIDELNNKQNIAWFQLGNYQYEKGDYDSAITSLLRSSEKQGILDKLYEIGLSFERKRQYDRALQVYFEIDIRNRKYKDIDNRIKSISGLSQPAVDVSSPLQGQQTLLIPNVELPEFGRYKIEKEIGRGAMGVVYLGIDPKINRRVAIKTLDYTQFASNELKALKARFFREAEAAGRLSHSNIVTVYDVGEEQGFAFIAMDYVEGLALSEFTQPDNLLPIDEVYRIVAVVADALDYAHLQNVVHRDIKPGNIMYNPQNLQIKITDFGIARITDSVKTRTGSFMGSPSYMAPEQMTGSRVNGQADLYALGVSFYQLLTGSLPFDADSLGNLAYKITNETHIPVRNVRADLPVSASRIINKALQKKTDKRFSTGAEMAKAIKRGLSDGA